MRGHDDRALHLRRGKGLAYWRVVGEERASNGRHRRRCGHGGVLDRENDIWLKPPKQHKTVIFTVSSHLA